MTITSIKYRKAKIMNTIKWVSCMGLITIIALSLMGCGTREAKTLKTLAKKRQVQKVYIDDKTICELFYVCCDDIQDMELTTALRQLLELLANGLENKMIAITSEVKSQLINWFLSQPAFIQALCPDFGWEV